MINNETNIVLLGFTHTYVNDGAPESLENQLVELKKSGFTDLVIETPENTVTFNEFLDYVKTGKIGKLEEDWDMYNPRNYYSRLT